MSQDEATKFRLEGNDFFRAKKYFDACRCYESALTFCGDSDNSQIAILYTNLSASQLQIEKISEAVESANKAIEHDKSYVKAYYRCGQALASCLDFKGAYDSYLAAAKIQPNVKAWRDLMQDAKNRLYSMKLREAMSSDDLESLAESVDQTTGEPVPIPEFTVEYARQLMDELSNDNRPRVAVVREMLNKMKEVHKKMDNIVNVQRKGIIRVVGDTHGQYQDVLHIFKTFGEPSSENPYLFNGDYVDRGSMGVEIVLTLFAWKLAIPDSIYLNRGNHETKMMNQMYGFEKECTSKYSKAMYQAFSEFFNTLPLGHILNGKVLIVHGGLFSDTSVTIDSLQKMDRFGQPPESGPLNDILWSDPMDEKGLAPSPRGVTRTFGPDITQDFLDRNNLQLLIRSHQVQENGYGVMHNGKCITVFSAPNYIGQMGNKGAIVRLVFNDDYSLKETEYDQFTAEPIPSKYPPMKYASFNNFFS